MTSILHTLLIAQGLAKVRAGKRVMEPIKVAEVGTAEMPVGEAMETTTGAAMGAAMATTETVTMAITTMTRAATRTMTKAITTTATILTMGIPETMGRARRAILTKTQHRRTH